MIELNIVNSIWEKYTNEQVFIERNFYDEISIRKNEDDSIINLSFPNPNMSHKFITIQEILTHFDIPFTHVVEIYGNKIGMAIILCHNETWYSYRRLRKWKNQYEICVNILTERIFHTIQK